MAVGGAHNVVWVILECGVSSERKGCSRARRLAVAPARGFAAIEISKIFLTYFRFNDFDTGPCPSYGSLESRCRSFLFFDNAAKTGFNKHR